MIKKSKTERIISQKEKRMTFWGGFTIGALVVGVLCALEVAIFRFFIITECY